MLDAFPTMASVQCFKSTTIANSDTMKAWCFSNNNFGSILQEYYFFQTVNCSFRDSASCLFVLFFFIVDHEMDSHTENA